VPLTLADGVYRVRSEIGELQQFNWSDYQIVTDLNVAAQEMSSVAGALTKFDNLVLTPGANGAQQEAFLNVEIDEVKACKYFQGTLFDLEYMDWRDVQVGTSTGSIPQIYYLKTSTREMTPQSTTTSDIVSVPILPGGAFYTVLGVWPIPPEPANIHVWYSYFHPQMQYPSDPCEIPRRFLKGWAAGCIARCLRIEKAHAEADIYEAQFASYTEQYRIYASRQRNANKPARYGTQRSPWQNNPSSSVIVVDPYSGQG
jgi:hypothetical protein